MLIAIGEGRGKRTSAAAAAAAGSWHGQVKFDLIKTQRERERERERGRGQAGCEGETSAGCVKEPLFHQNQNDSKHGCSVKGTCKDIERSLVG